MSLSDTPAAFTANKVLKVNSAGDAIEFADEGGSFTSLSATPNALVAGKVLKVNAGTDTTTINISSGLTTGTQTISGDKTFSDDVTLSGNTSVSSLSFDGAAMAGHILPTQNAQFDIGSAEYKVRHLFL